MMYHSGNEEHARDEIRCSPDCLLYSVCLKGRAFDFNLPWIGNGPIRMNPS